MLINIPSQPFWGSMIAKAGAGPDPIPHASVSCDNLASAIQFCLTPEATAAAGEISLKMQAESGVAAAVDSFHGNLPLDRMRCAVMPNQVAAWTYKKARRPLNLSKAAVEILIEHNSIQANEIRPYVTLLSHISGLLTCSPEIRYPVNPIIIENRRWDPLTGVLSAATSTGTNMAKSTGEMFYNPYKEFKRSLKPPEGGSGSPSTSRSGSSAGMQSSNSLASRSTGDQRPDPFDTAGNMAGAGLKAFGKYSGSYFRGVVVDIPHAAAEGFRRAPQLYGEKPKDHGRVHDWKSGFAVGGKNFVGGMAGGVSDIVKHPLKGYVEEGGPGATKGLAKGVMGLATKMPSGECFLPLRILGAATNICW